MYSLTAETSKMNENKRSSKKSLETGSLILRNKFMTKDSYCWLEIPITDRKKKLATNKDVGSQYKWQHIMTNPWEYDNVKEIVHRIRVKLYRGLKIHMASSAGIVKIGSSQENLKIWCFPVFCAQKVLVKNQLLS